MALLIDTTSVFYITFHCGYSITTRMPSSIVSDLHQVIVILNTKFDTK